MRRITGLIPIALIALFMLPGWSADRLLAEESATAETGATTETAATEAAGDLDEEWLNTVWTQVDDMVKQESLELQKTVTVAGVRGAEAEDSILDKLYYKGAKRYPSQEKLRKAIDTLKKAIARAPRGEDVAMQTYFVAQCYTKLGETTEARTYFTQVTRDHADTPWAAKARKELAALANPPAAAGQ